MPRRVAVVPHPNNAVVSRKEAKRREVINGADEGTSKVRRPSTPSYIDTAARKVSTELEKACDEAFYRQSAGSTVVSADSSALTYQTPPSTASRHTTPNYLRSSNGGKSTADRPLPPTPSETPNTFLARELQETRQRLAQRYALEGVNDERISHVINRLDDLIDPDTQKRHFSAPDEHHFEANWLPTLPEEEVGYTHGQNAVDRRLRSQARAVTEPYTPTYKTTVQHQSKESSRPIASRDTIRFVDGPNSNPVNVAPLNIRKKPSFTPSSTSAHEPTPRRHEKSPSFLSDFDPSGHNSWRNSREPPAATISAEITSSPTKTSEHPKEPELKTATKKRSGWFKWKTTDTKNQAKETAIELESKQSFSEITQSMPTPTNQNGQSSARQPNLLRKKGSRVFDSNGSTRSDSSEFPIRSRASVPTNLRSLAGQVGQKEEKPKKRLWAIFRNKRSHNKSSAMGLQLASMSSPRSRVPLFPRASNSLPPPPKPYYSIDLSSTASSLSWSGRIQLSSARAYIFVSGPEDFSTDSLLTSYELPDGLSNPPMMEPTHSNWLARFLHIKPSIRVLCFQVGRGRARSELVRLLRDWRRYGIRDVSFSRERNIISARVDKNNYLRIKPVSFSIELFTILEHGRRAQLSLGRFMQTRGAASSFRKVLQVIEDVLKVKGILVEQEEKRKGMLEILG
jgi:serine/threonine-protein kinase HSL1, negative regulator of Swe1 kinase